MKDKTMPNDKTVTVTLMHDDAWNLAVFLKRVGWDEIQANAKDNDEAAALRNAIERAQAALADAGVTPR